MRFSVGLLAILTFVVFGCSQEEPELPTEKVEFTSMILSFEARGLKHSFDLEYRDPEGDGNPVINTAVLKPNTIYDVAATFLDESITPPRNVTQDFYVNNAAYTMCYEKFGLDLVIQRVDGNGSDEFGLSTIWTTTDASEGSVLVTVAYQPEERDNACGVGEKQLEVQFFLNVREGTSPN